MNDREAMAAYDAAGAKRAGVRWPDVDLDRENLRRLFEGALDEHLDLAALAFGDQANRAGAAERIEEAWRLDAMRVRFAPEGVFARARFSVRLRLWGDGPAAEAPEDEAALTIEGELCLSFTERNHTRPFVDFMGGRLRVEEPAAMDAGASPAEDKRIDPFALMISPQLAVAWGLNAASLPV